MFTKNSRFGIIKLYMINKGELYMEYRNTDEATRREACERVKQIVKAIKAMKIKYYLDFARIPAKDKETYQKLEANLEQISNSHNLNNLKVALMQEVSAKYDRHEEQDGQQHEIEPDDILQKCYGAIDAQKEALSKGRITQARKCQEILIRYMQKVDLENYRDLIINYKREKFAELVRARDEVEEQNVAWSKIMRGFYKEKHVVQRQKMVEMITAIPQKDMIHNQLKDEIVI